MKSTNSQHLLIQECIFEALMQLMEKKDFDKITVTDLVERAGVSRASYYRNYSSKCDILTDAIDKSFDEYIKLIDTIPFDRYTYLLISVSCIRQNQRLIQNLLKENMSYLLLERYKEYFRSIYADIVITPNLSVTDKNYEIPYIIGGMFEVIRQWAKDGFSKSDEELADILFALSDRKNV